MADNPVPAKSERKPVRTSSLLTNVLLALLDMFLTLFLFITPLCSYGAYMYFVLPEFAIGVMYVVVRIILKNVEQTNFTNHCYIALRIFGITIAVIYYVILFNFGNIFSWFYPIRKNVYIAGNYMDAAYFDFLPESIPAKADKYYMDFVPPMYAPDAWKSIDIHFETDETGMSEMRKAAIAKGGIPFDITYTDIVDDLIKSKMEHFCETCGVDVDKSEVYMIRKDSDRSLIIYLISNDTGYCRIYWLL